MAKLKNMNVSKASLWLTNILIGTAIVWFVGLVGFQFVGVGQGFDKKQSEDLIGARSKTATFKYSVPEFDLEYYFIYREGKVVIDQYLISPKNIGLNYNYTKATENDFISVSAGDKHYKISTKTGQLYLPIDEADVLFYRYLSLFEMLLLSVIKVLILLWIRRLILNFSKGEFFVSANHQLLYRIGGLLAIVPIILFAFESYFTNGFTSLGLSLPEGYSLNMKGVSFQWNYMYISLLLILTAQAFKQGIELEIDKDLTI